MRRVVLMGIIAATLTGGYFWVQRENPTLEKQQVSESLSEEGQEAKNEILKSFSGAQFRELYDSTAYPNSAFISEKSPITGNDEADKHIRELAEKRGYKKRSAPVADNFINLGDNFLLQPRAAKAWSELKNSAKSEGIELMLTAAYRSAESQKAIFLKRLGPIASADIISGRADSRISSILRTTALPGYSRHHTGYTVDIACQNDPNVIFEASLCFNWLSKNNYQKAKMNGWIPSYPDGAGKQGPDPEAWEYVWVGEDVLYE